jgi:glyoxalase family protein
MQLTGIHHLTAVTADAPRNHDFYTRTLGMRLVKKTVNQDDTSAYHLFYADGKATPGSDITFFDWRVTPDKRGMHSISRTGLRVTDDETLGWWKKCFEEEGVTHAAIVERDGRGTLDSRISRDNASAWLRTAAWAKRIRGTAARFRHSIRSAASGRSRSACPTGR